MMRETFLRQRLADLHRAYLKDCEPIIRELAEIEARLTPTQQIVGLVRALHEIGAGKFAPMKALRDMTEQDFRDAHG